MNKLVKIIIGVVGGLVLLGMCGVALGPEEQPPAEESAAAEEPTAEPTEDEGPTEEELAQQAREDRKAERKAKRQAKAKERRDRKAERERQAAEARREAKEQRFTVQVTSTGSSSGMVTYGDPTSDAFNLAQETDAGLPWSRTWEGVESLPIGWNMNAQQNSGGELTCRVMHGGRVIAENTSSGAYSMVTCAP